MIKSITMNNNILSSKDKIKQLYLKKLRKKALLNREIILTYFVRDNSPYPEEEIRPK